MDQNVDYKEMYFKMARATEDALRILIKAQQECEEIYVGGCEVDIPPFEEFLAEILAISEASSTEAELSENIS